MDESWRFRISLHDIVCGHALECTHERGHESSLANIPSDDLWNFRLFPTVSSHYIADLGHEYLDVFGLDPLVDTSGIEAAK
jgi:hypothetical protein